MSKPLVSVIMCQYNTNPSYLNEAILSIINQTYRNLEFIIIDDCSEKEIDLSNYNDDRIKYIRNQVNLGPGVSRQIAINGAKGKYIVLMDSDDISELNRIEEQVNFMETNEDIVAAGTWFKFFGDKNHEVKREIDDNELYRCNLFFNNSPTLLNPSVIIRRSTLLENNINFENLRYAEDYMLWVKLSQYGKITNIKKVLLNYRVHPNQLSKFGLSKKSIECKKLVYNYQISKVLGNVSFDSTPYLDYVLSGKLKPRKFKKALDTYEECNKLTLFFDPLLFKQVIDEKLYNVIRKTKNPFKLLCFSFINKETSKLTRLSICNRIKRKY